MAQLAGVAAAVVRRARAMLAQLEERAAGTRPQLDLFNAAREQPVVPAALDALRTRLDGVDVDALSPRDALELVYELKRLAAE